MPDNEKVFFAETIEPNPLPIQDEEVSLDPTQKTSNDRYSATEIKAQPVQRTKFAHELISSALNTKSKKILQEFEFVLFGALQIGKHANGVTGDVRISPIGIVARNKSGIITFALDGETGNAVFRGEVQAGAFISGRVEVGDGDIVIDGDTKRMIWYNSGVPTIVIGNV